VIFIGIQPSIYPHMAHKFVPGLPIFR